MKACPPSRAAAEQIKQAPYGAKTRWKWGQTQEAGGWQSLHPHARPHLELQARVGLGRALHRAGAAPAAPAPCSAGARLHSSAWLCSEPLVPLPACSGAEDGTEAAHGSPSSCGGSGWTWLTSGWALDLPGITPCTLPHGSLRSPALPPESQIQGELQPASPLQSLQPQKLAGIPPYSFRTPRTSSPAVGRMESGIFFYLPQPSPHLDTLPQTCSSQVPVCFQACHLHTQAPGGEMPPDRAGHPHGWVFGGAERPQLLCSQLPAHPSQHPAHLGLGPSMGQRDPVCPGDGHGELPGSEGSPQTLADLLQL